jgi:nitrate reductase NapAB chaperone NapD
MRGIVLVTIDEALETTIKQAVTTIGGEFVHLQGVYNGLIVIHADTLDEIHQMIPKIKNIAGIITTTTLVEQ